MLNRLLNIASLGSSPFQSYVYFISLKTFTDLGWGTPSPILFRDTEFKMVNLRAHGSFAVRISDPKTFLRTIVGTKGVETTYKLEQYLRSIIVSRFSQTVSELMTTVLDMTAKYEELAVKVKNSVADHFEQYGLMLVDLLVEAVTVPPEVQEAINRAAGTRAVGSDELSHYERVMRSEALRDGAKQPGGAAGQGLGAGLGLGAGMGIARDMVNQPQPDSQQKLTPDQIKAKLKELKSLLDEDLITQEDFESQKKRLLNQL
mgnify:CR=1 FL=1